LTQRTALQKAGGEEFEEFKGFEVGELGELGELGKDGKGAECVGNPGENILYAGETPARVAGGACYDANRRHRTRRVAAP
jgi:hypothetical protein